MMSVRNLLAGAALIVGTALGSANASAATVIANYQSVGVGDTIGLHAVRPNGQTIAEQVLLGVSVFNRTGGTSTETFLGSSANSFYAFCIEPYEDAYLNSTYSLNVDPLASGANSSIAGGIGSVKAGLIGSLFGQFAPNLAAPMSALQASALQLAIWEIVSELPSNPFDVTTGNTYFTGGPSGALSLAQSYLNYVSTANGSGPQAQGLRALTANGSQDFLVQVPITAPEPGTWMMMLIGFGLVGGIARTRRGGQAERQLA